MDFATCIARRRMVRSYLSDRPDRGAIDRCVAAALSAPTAGHSQGVHLAVVTGAGTRAAIAEAAGETEWVARGHTPWLGSAPVHVVLGARPRDYVERYSERDKAAATSPLDWPVPYWWIDCGAALEAILLASVDEGLGAGFLGVHAIPGLAGLVGWTDIHAAGVVTIGHAADTQPVGSAGRVARRAGRVSWLDR